MNSSVTIKEIGTKLVDRMVQDPNCLSVLRIPGSGL
jgi:hypothetical protein